MAEAVPVFCNPFYTGDFLPRWLCGNWTPLHGWTHIVADAAIFGAYAAIPALIAYFMLKRRDVQLPSLWWLFASFIFFCGLGHLIDAAIFWWPAYRFSATIKVITAIVSWGTVLVLARRLPELLSLPGMRQLNGRLREEIAARTKTEDEKERFFNLSLDLLCIADMSGRFTRVNPAFFDVLGYTAEELTARPFLDFVHPDDRAATEVEMQGLREGRSTFVFENRYKTKDGRWRWLAWRATPWSEGELVYATARDVTERKQTQASLIAAAEAEARQVQRSLHLHEVLLHLRDEIRGDPAEFYRQAARACADALEVERVSIWRFDEQRSELRRLEQHDRSGRAAASGPRLAATEFPRYFSAVAREDSVIVADNARAHPDTTEFFPDKPGFQDVTSMLDAPVRSGDDLAGLLCCEHTGAARKWTADEVRFVTALAGYVMLAIQQDEQQHTESALQRSEELNRRIIQSLEDQLRVLTLDGSVIGTVDPDSPLTTRSPFGETDWVSTWHEQSRAAAHAALHSAVAGKATRFQGATAVARGPLVWWDVIVSPINGDDGLPSRVLVVSRDITQQRRNEEEVRHLNTNLEQVVAERTAEVAASEERFRLMVDQVQDYAIYMLDCDGHVASWNHGAQRSKGYTSPEIVGRHFSCFYTPEDIELDKPAALLRKARERGRVRDEGWRVRKDGTRFWAEVVVTAIHGEDGALRGFAKVTHDLTERKKIEAQSMRSQRLESIGTLAGGIAHDLNNALAPILMAIGVLRSSHPESHEIIELIEGSASRGADMVRHLLTFAKGVEGERVAVPPARLVGEVAKIIHSTFPKNIQLVTRVPEHPPALLGDATQLHQVLINLCVNARDAMPGGGVLTVEVSDVQVDAAFVGTLNVGDARLGRHVCIRVSDTGCGIPPDVVDRIFDPFFTTKSPDRGSGLGLSNALGIIKGHGGFFHVYSHVGRGTSIAAYLPVASDESAKNDSRSPFGELLGHGEQVLFVDDEASVRAVARRVLAALNYAPLTANDGTDALIQVAQHRSTLHAVITDLHMPHMDGEALVRALRRMAPDKPIIAASGRIDDMAAERLRQLGVKIILPKPFTQEQLARALSLAAAGKAPAPPSS